MRSRKPRSSAWTCPQFSQQCTYGCIFLDTWHLWLTNRRVPPNCRFEIDDVEKDWTWSKPFDFIYSRVMAGSFSNYEDYIKKAYK